MISSDKMKIYSYIKFGLFFFILFLFPHQGFTQKDISLKDGYLESLIRENQLKAAEAYLVEKINARGLSPEKTAYYQSRYSQLFLQKGEFEKALAYAKAAKKYIEKDKRSPMWGDVNRALCFAYIRKGNLDSALYYAEKLYQFSQENDDLPIRRTSLVALGNISLQNKLYQKSLDFYNEALLITESLKDTLNLKVDYYNVGLALSQLNEHEKSNTYLLKSAIRAEKEKALDLLARCYGTIADNYLDQNNFSAQIAYLKKANKIASEIGNHQLLAMGYANLAETALRNGEYKETIFYGNQSSIHLSNRPLIQLQAKVDSMRYIAYKNLGDFKFALNMLEKYDKERQSIRSESQKDKLNQLTIEFEVEKKDLQIANQLISIREEKAKNQSFLIGIGFLVSLSFFLSYTTIKNSKTRRILFKKEQEIDMASKLSFTPREEFPFNTLLSENERLVEKDYEKLFNELIVFIKEKKLYLNPRINQQTLVTEFGTNRQYIYEAIAKNGEDNFRGIINRFRINEVKELIKKDLVENKPLELIKIYELAGFNSYSTFYRSFKTITGLSPNEFVDELKKNLKQV